MVGGVAQCLRRRSLAGELSWCLIYGRQITTSWIRCPLWVNQLVELSLPSFWDQFNEFNSCNYMDYGDGDH